MKFGRWYSSQKVTAQAAIISGTALIGAAVVAGIFGVIDLEVAKPGAQAAASAPAPTLNASASRSAPPSPSPLQVVSPAPTSPALTLYDPGSTGAEGLAFSADGTLAVGDLNTRVYLWNVTTAQVTATFQVPDRQIAWSVAFSPDSGTVAGGTSNSSYNYGNIYLWDIATRKLVTTLTNPGTRGITGIAFSPDGGTLAVGDTNANTYLWDMSWLRP